MWAHNYTPPQPGTILRLPEGKRRDLHPGRGGCRKQDRLSSGWLWREALHYQPSLEDTGLTAIAAPAAPRRRTLAFALAAAQLSPSPLAVDPGGVPAVVAPARSRFSDAAAPACLIHTAAHSLRGLWQAAAGPHPSQALGVAIYFWPCACVNGGKGAREALCSHRGILFGPSQNCSRTQQSSLPAWADHVGGALC